MPQSISIQYDVVFLRLSVCVDVYVSVLELNAPVDQYTIRCRVPRLCVCVDVYVTVLELPPSQNVTHDNVCCFSYF